MQALSPAAYLLRMSIAMLGMLLMVWIYVLTFPMAFLGSGYASWVAKETMLQECRLGTIAFFGDSKVEAGIIPAALPVTASNFGFAANSAIGVQSEVTSALRCGQKPGFVVVSLSITSFGPLGEFFWVDALRYGFITPDELWNLERTAAQLDDTVTLTEAKTADGLSGPVRDWLYALHFPSLYFSNLVQAQVFRRANSNYARLAQTLQARGYVPYGNSAQPAPDDLPGSHTDLQPFVVTKLQSAYFERTLQTLQDHGMMVGLLLMPVKSAPNAAMTPGETDYVNYLRSLAARFRNVRVINPRIPQWPSAMFTDAEHLNPAGSQAFSARLAACVEGETIRGDCDLSWDTLLGDASAHPGTGLP